LAKDIARAIEEVIADLICNGKSGVRNGDTDIAERQQQKRNMPEVLIITPESCICYLHKKAILKFSSILKIIAVDEWQ
jgi:ATP-dependent Lhr-like helicase